MADIIVANKLNTSSGNAQSTFTAHEEAKFQFLVIVDTPVPLKLSGRLIVQMATLLKTIHSIWQRMCVYRVILEPTVFKQHQLANNALLVSYVMEQLAQIIQ